jgi:hypothetical protein
VDQHLRAWSPANEIVNHEITGIKVTLRAEPHVVADDASAVVTPLQKALRSDEHVVPELERREMLEADAHADVESVSTGVRDRPQEDAAHHRVETAHPHHESRIQIEQFLLAALRAQRRRKPDLVSWIFGHRAASVDRIDAPTF